MRYEEVGDYFLRISENILQGTKANQSQKSLSCGRDSNPGTLAYEADMLTMYFRQLSTSGVSCTICFGLLCNNALHESTDTSSNYLYLFLRKSPSHISRELDLVFSTRMPGLNPM
jgi:hypothetical protein